jgi:nucleoside-triphosphatase
MKIFLRGFTGIGKSTVLAAFADLYPDPMGGILTSEVRDVNRQRVGFRAETPDGTKSKLIAHRYEIKSDVIVANKYRVDVEAVGSFVVPEIRRAMEDPDRVVLIDEIGRMQLKSKDFVLAARAALDSKSFVLGSVVQDEPLTEEFRKHPNIVLVEVTVTNRELLHLMLLDIYTRRAAFARLTYHQHQAVRVMMRKYFEHGDMIQLSKLVRNAIPYVTGAKVLSWRPGFKVLGNYAERLVFPENGHYRCDCPLFLGTGRYEGYPGDCSHVQAVRLFVAG